MRVAGLRVAGALGDEGEKAPTAAGGEGGGLAEERRRSALRGLRAVGVPLEEDAERGKVEEGRRLGEGAGGGGGGGGGVV